MSAPAIHELIPHRGAMCLIQRLIESDEKRIAVALTVPVSGMFACAAGMPAWVGLEYMAQAIAAWAGLRAQAQGQPPPLGFLLGTRRYVCTLEYFPPGAELRVEAECEILGENGLGAFACCILLHGQTVAEALVSVFQPADAQAYLESEAR